VCTSTDASHRSSSCSFQVTVTRAPSLIASRFLAFGDSITCGESGTDDLPVCSPPPFSSATVLRRFSQVPPSQTYPAVLQAELAARYVTEAPIVANQGNSGESITTDTASRLSNLLAANRFDVVLLMEGSNNVMAGDAAAAADVGPAIELLRQMVRDVKSRGSRAFLATIPPQVGLACCPRRGQGGILVTEFNDQVRLLASSEGAALVDVYQALNTDVNTFIGFDGLHPTVPGYARIADTFFGAIKQMLESQSTTFANPLRFRQAPAR
jgi:lysophospholipase L1-like esterase